MRISETEKGMKVEDQCYPENGVGEVISKKENEVRVKFPSFIKKYNIINLSNLKRIAD